MARRYNPSQFRSKLRQIQSKLKQDLSRIEREARQRQRQNQQKLRQAANDLDRAVRNYNQAARTHNAKVRANRARIDSALSRLKSAPRITTHTVYRTSTGQLHESFVRFERVAETSTNSELQRLYDLSELENANSLEASEALLGDAAPEDDEQQLDQEDLNRSRIRDQLRRISDDLHMRWEGAVFALSPKNPDASRHFCSSAREIFVQILDTFAPNADVIAAVPECPLTDQGTPTRRSKVHFILSRRGIDCNELEEFVENDIANVLELFHVFNAGTHGASGKYGISQLMSIKQRVEDGILFLYSVVQA